MVYNGSGSSFLSITVTGKDPQFSVTAFFLFIFFIYFTLSYKTTKSETMIRPDVTVMID